MYYFNEIFMLLDRFTEHSVYTHHMKTNSTYGLSDWICQPK